MRNRPLTSRFVFLKRQEPWRLLPRHEPHSKRRSGIKWPVKKMGPLPGRVARHDSMLDLKFAAGVPHNGPRPLTGLIHSGRVIGLETSAVDGHLARPHEI